MSGEVTLSATDVDGKTANASVRVEVAVDLVLTSGARRTEAPVDLGTAVEIWANVTGGPAQFTLSTPVPPQGAGRATARRTPALRP